MSRLFTQGEQHVTLAFERQPLLEQPRRRPMGRWAWFTLGVVLGLLLAAFAR